MEENKKFCVYLHRNRKDGKIYVGQTCQKPEERWRPDGNGYKGSPHFWRAIQKDGWENFDHIILEDELSLEEANQKEQYYIDFFHSTDSKFGYNIMKGGRNSLKTEEHKKKISQSNIGKHPHQGEQNPMYGRHFSQKSKDKIRNSQPARKRVQCIETGAIFESARAAAKWCGLRKDGHIPSVCRGERKIAGGYHWRYADE